MFAFSALAITASLAAVVVADHGHDLHARSHHHLERAGHHFQKRAFTGQATYYAVGLGACGQNSQPSDFIVALNSAQYGGGYPGPHCFQSVRICKSGTGNCQTAVIMDECPTCAYGSLDMSESLFKAFASLDDGVFQMSWTFSGDNGDDQPTTTSKKPTPTKEPEPTTTWTPETTSWEAPTTTSTKKKTTTSPPPETTSTPESTSSSTSTTPTTTSTSEALSSSSSSTPTPTPTSTSTSTSHTSAAPSASANAVSGSSSGSSGGSNLADANQILLSLGKLAIVANGGQ